jgi:hypothetical protein
MTVKKLRAVPCHAVTMMVPYKHSDHADCKMSSDLVLRDWLSGFSQCHAVTLLHALIFHTHMKSALLQN